MGSEAHIVLNHGDWEQAKITQTSFRVQTYCGKSLKYNVRYSSMEGRNGIVRNACPNCFTEYEPEEHLDYYKAHEEWKKGDLPF